MTLSTVQYSKIIFSLSGEEASTEMGVAKRIVLNHCVTSNCHATFSLVEFKRSILVNIGFCKLAANSSLLRCWTVFTGS